MALRHLLWVWLVVVAVGVKGESSSETTTQNSLLLVPQGPDPIKITARNNNFISRKLKSSSAFQEISDSLPNTNSTEISNDSGSESDSSPTSSEPKITEGLSRISGPSTLRKNPSTPSSSSLDQEPSPQVQDSRSSDGGGGGSEDYLNDFDDLFNNNSENRRSDRFSVNVMSDLPQSDALTNTQAESRKGKESSSSVKSEPSASARSSGGRSYGGGGNIIGTGTGISIGGAYKYPSSGTTPRPIIMPIYTQKPIFPAGGGSGGGWRPSLGGTGKPSYVGYKPGSSYSTMSPIVFPAVTQSTLPPPLPITEDSFGGGEGPVGPPGGLLTPTPDTITIEGGDGGGVVPVIGGGEEDIFPPSPPEVEDESDSSFFRRNNKFRSRNRSRITGGGIGTSSFSTTRTGNTVRTKITNIESVPPGPPAETFSEEDFRDNNDELGRSSAVKSSDTKINNNDDDFGVNTGRSSASSFRSRFNSRFGTPASSSSRKLSSSGSESSKKFRSRLRDRVKDSLEEAEADKETEALLDYPAPADDESIIRDFVFSDIKCFKTRGKEYFGATIHMKSGFHPPYVRDRPQDPLLSKECSMENALGSDDAFNMRITDLKGCGVEQCGDSMCLTMVFPRVPTLALADDEVTTIKCAPQKTVMSDTRTINFAGEALESRRSSSTVEGGSQDFAAEVGIFRQSSGSNNGLFVKRVNSGGMVQLGESLQLRSIVRGGDGWKHSKVSDVKVWRMRDAFNPSNVAALDTNDATEVVTLVDNRGCRNDEYAVIADNQPLKDPRNDLINHFNFKAFLFRGQRTNEPLLLTAKVHACHEETDCFPGCDTRSARVKRSPEPVEIFNASSLIHDWDSQFALRVVGHQGGAEGRVFEDEVTEETPYVAQTPQGRSFSSSSSSGCTEKMATSGVLGGLVTLLLTGIVIGLYSFVAKGRKEGEDASCQAHNMEKGHGQGPPPPPLTPHRPLQPPTSTRPSPVNKPLPPPPTTSNAEPHHIPPNVTKIVHQLVSDKGNYASIADVHQHTMMMTPSSEVRKSHRSKNKNKDGVYIVYMNKEGGNGGGDGGKRPKSAPPTLRKNNKYKNSSKSNRNKPSSSSVRRLEQVFSDSQSEERLSSSESEVSSSASSSSVNSSLEEIRGSRPTITFAPSARRTVRNVKSRSSHHHHHHHQNVSHKQKVINGLRRRFSIGGGNKGGGTPVVESNGWSYSSARLNNKSKEPSSSDSAFSEGGCSTPNSHPSYDDSPHILQELASAAANKVKDKKKGQAYYDKQVRLHLTSTPKSQSSPPLPPGETQATHFVTRNDSSTQIIIVPETHV